MEGQKGNSENTTPSKDAFQKATPEITPPVKSTPTQTAVSLSTAGSGSGSKVRSPAVVQAAGTKGVSPFFTSPDSESKSKKSVKHLECAYFFGSEGCKWTAEACLYAHYRTGIRASTPVTIEPGRPPVAGKNATNPHPQYHNWRNSSNEGGVEYATRPASPSPQITTRPEVPFPLRQQIDRIRTKAAHSQNFYHPPRPQNQSSQIGPIPPATPTMGHASHNVNAQPLSSPYHKVEEATQPGPSMTSPAGSPGMAMPINPANTPINAAASHPGPLMVNTPMNIVDPYYRAHPQPFVQHGAYYLSPPPAGPGQQEYEAALQHYRRELEATQQELATRTAENTTLRNELTKTQAELQAATNVTTKLRMVCDAAIDTILTLEYHSDTAVLRFRLMCSTEAKKTWTVTNELNQMVFNPRLGDVRPEVRRPRDMLIEVVKAHLDGLDYGYEYCGQSSRLRAWFREQVELAGDEEALRHLDKGVSVLDDRCVQFLLRFIIEVIF
ncbi:hypothetical protein G7Y79_00002g006620 [Physcia stellaris]|nr:hypothetical protein G7Y79_00002g006620 [Physcia stellaris]